MRGRPRKKKWLIYLISTFSYLFLRVLYTLC
jgi:hypothetical protein